MAASSTRSRRGCVAGSPSRARVVHGAAAAPVSALAAARTRAPRGAIAALPAALLLVVTAPVAHGGVHDDQFRALHEEEWSWRLTQTRGAEEEEGIDTVVAKLPPVHAAAQDEKLRYWQQVKQRLDAIPVSELSPANQISYQVYRYQIDVLIDRQKYRDYEMPLYSSGGFWTNLRFNAAKLPLFKSEDYDAYVSQLSDFPRFFRENIDNMRAGLKRGFTQPKVTVAGRDGSIASVANAQDPRATDFYKPFLVMPGSIRQVEQERLRAAGARVIRDAVIPAHAELLRFMREEYVPGARATLAARELPDGTGYYRAKIREFVTVDLAPDEIHRIGIEEVSRIHEEMAEVIRRSGFEGDFAAFQTYLRTDPQFYARTPAELLARAAVLSKEFDGKVSQYFGRLPRQRFAIIPMPADIAPFATGALGGAGYYYLNTYDLPARPLYVLPALTLHESAPGHAFQVPLALENEDLPGFRRKVYISAYGEGWALYCERLGEELGMYHTPYELFGMLSYQMYRAARLVVDTGLHYVGWSRPRAIEFMRAHTSLNDTEINNEVDRYIAAPAQALSYYIGAMTIWKARRKAEAALGAKFDIRAFHDTVLELGSVPMSVLEARMERFIAESGRSPYADPGR